MSNNNLDNFQKQSAEEEFLRLAALEIESEENKIFMEAQSLPDPDPEVLQAIQVNLLESMRKTNKKQRNHKIFLQLGRLTACTAALCCLLLTGVYFGVDAARVSVNNFVMELFDGHATVRTELSENQVGALLPENWGGAFSVEWVPARFTNVRSSDLNTSWMILYRNEQKDQNLSIYVWESIYAPTVSTEGMNLISQENIQGAAATIYSDSSGETSTLIWVKANYVIQIGGTILPEEAKKIAENFSF